MPFSTYFGGNDWFSHPWGIAREMMHNFGYGHTHEMDRLDRGARSAWRSSNGTSPTTLNASPKIWTTRHDPEPLALDGARTFPSPPLGALPPDRQPNRAKRLECAASLRFRWG